MTMLERRERFTSQALKLGWSQDTYGNLHPPEPERKGKERISFTPMMARLESREPRHKYTQTIFWVRKRSATLKKAKFSPQGELINFEE